MKTTDELKQLYESKLKPSLQAIEAQRKKLLIKYVLSIGGILVSFEAAFMWTHIYPILFYIAVVVIITSVYHLLFVIRKQRKAYRISYKQNIVKAIVELINPDWKYDSVGRINPKDYKNSQLFSSLWDKYDGDDLVKGIIEKTDFELSELHTRYKTYSNDSDGGKKENWHTIFKGLFAHAEFNKDIKGRTFVLPEKANKNFKEHGVNKQNDTKLVKLENPEFEKIFKVYSTDQIESRYILTPAMMEAMVTIYRKFDKGVYFSFIGSRVYIAMSFTQDLFEPRILKSGVRFEDMEQMNDNFRLIQLVIHEMNLNTRIWTKT